MDPLLQPIETYKLPIAFKAADIFLPSNQDWIFEMEKEVVSSVFYYRISKFDDAISLGTVFKSFW